MSELKTDRLTLKRYCASDRDKLINLLTNPKVMKFADGVLSRETVEDFWENKVITTDKGFDLWAVFFKDTEYYLGNASVRSRPNEPNEWEIGFLLRESEWGKGYATEIAGGLVRYCFDVLDLDFVCATVDDDHDASIGVLKKTGFSFKRYEWDKIGRFSVYQIENRASEETISS